MNKERQQDINRLIKKELYNKRGGLSRRGRLARTFLIVAALTGATMGLTESHNAKIKNKGPLQESIISKPTEIDGVPKVNVGEIAVVDDGPLVTVAIGVESTPSIERAFKAESNHNFSVTVSASDWVTGNGIPFPESTGTIGKYTDTTTVSNGTSSEKVGTQNTYVLILTGEKASTASPNYGYEALNNGVSGEVSISITSNNTGNTKDIMSESFVAN